MAELPATKELPVDFTEREMLDHLYPPRRPAPQNIPFPELYWLGDEGSGP